MDIAECEFPSPRGEKEETNFIPGEVSENSGAEELCDDNPIKTGNIVVVPEEEKSLEKINFDDDENTNFGHSECSFPVAPTVLGSEADLSTIISQPRECPTVLQKRTRAPPRILTADTTHVPIQTSDIIEYEWPIKSGDRYFIQEQICQLLDVNSFKRKYPELSRRAIEPKERDYLIKQLGLSTVLPSTSLTALQAVEIYDLMSTEYPSIFTEYKKACADKIKKAMFEKQKELNMIKLDAKKMEELRQKAIRSAVNFNNDLQAIRRSERQQFWDLQTNTIHSQSNKWMRLPKEYTRSSNYPVFLIPGQFVSHYKRYSSAELRRLPLETIIENPELFPPKRPSSPPPIKITDEELGITSEKGSEDGVKKEDVDSNEISYMVGKSISSPSRISKPDSINAPSPSTRRKNSHDFGGTPPPSKLRRTSMGRKGSTPQISFDFAIDDSKSVSTPSPKTSSATDQPTNKPSTSSSCAICKGIFTGINCDTGDQVACASCGHNFHPTCIDMSKSMAQIVRQYAWNCIDCKTCSVCHQPDQEAAMMCCDSCDRGYHTFCIGLSKPPSGIWHCSICENS